MRKKFLALTLASAVAVTALAACDNGGNDKTEAQKSTESDTKAPDESKGTETEATKETEAPSTEEAVDMGGYEVVIGDWWTDPDAALTSVQQQDTQAFREEMMAKYNFKVVQKAICQWGEMTDTCVQSIQADDPACQVFVLDSSFVAQPLSNGLFYDLATLDNMDLSEDKWNQSDVELMTHGDHIYGFAIGAAEPRTGVFFNKRLLKEAGYDEDALYDFQKNGEWTWDKFEEVCQKCTRDTDGDGQMDYYAMASFSCDFIPAAVASNDAEFIGYKDGKYTNETGGANFLEALTWSQGLFQKYEMAQPADSNWDWFVAAFHDGKVAMTVAEEYKVSNWADMEDDWGFVMFPQGPKMDHSIQVIRDNILIIPACYDKEEAEKIAFVMDKYANPTPGYESDEDWALAFYANFRDERAVDETLALMRDASNQTFSYNPLIAGLDLGAAIMYDVYGGSATPQEKIESAKDEIDAKIADANAL